MLDRFTRIAMLVVVLLLSALVAEPYVARYFLSQTAPRPVAARGDLAQSERAAIEVFERVSPSVVHIAARPAGRNPGSLEEPGSGVATGTGFVWDAAGHIVTNNHVVQGGRSVIVKLSSGEIEPAEVVGTAPNYDLAVVRLSGVRRVPPPIAIGASSDLKVGQATYAIGNPFGLDQTLTTGVVSALQRRLPTSAGREIADVIQTDAAINPGNSGGPLLDSAGRLIGVNTAIYSPSGAFAGIGFAIPVDVVNRVVPQLIRDGHMPTPGIGIVAAPETSVARLGLEGLVIVRTQLGSPAERAGLREINPTTGDVGDIIVAINGKPVRRLSDLTGELERAGVGSSVEITVLRAGAKTNVRVSVIDLSRAP